MKYKLISMTKKCIMLSKKLLINFWKKIKDTARIVYINNSIMRNVIAIMICIVLELFGVWVYIQWTKIGETRIAIESSTIIDNNNIKTYGIVDEIYVPINYGGIHELQTDTVIANIDTAEVHIKRTGSIQLSTLYSAENTNIEPDNKWDNAKRVKNDNYMNIISFAYYSSVPLTKKYVDGCYDTIYYDWQVIKTITPVRRIFMKNGVVIDSIDTIQTDFRSDTNKIVTFKNSIKINKYKDYGSKVEAKTSIRFSKDTSKEFHHHQIFGSRICVPPKWYRFEDLSRRFICLDISKYNDSISKLIIDFYGPFKVVSSDIPPDSLTMSRLLFFHPSTINKLKMVNGDIPVGGRELPRLFFIEFPYMEHVQEFRILALTTLLISVLLTLILNCFMAVGKTVRQENKMKKIRIDSIPCYGSFSDCSECSMYKTCSYRPMNIAYYRTHRKLHSTHQEE